MVFFLVPCKVSLPSINNPVCVWRVKIWIHCYACSCRYISLSNTKVFSSITWHLTLMIISVLKCSVIRCLWSSTQRSIASSPKIWGILDLRDVQPNISSVLSSATVGGMCGMTCMPTRIQMGIRLHKPLRGLLKNDLYLTLGLDTSNYWSYIQISRS